MTARLALFVLPLALLGSACKGDSIVGRWVLEDDATGWREECAFFSDGRYTLAAGTPEARPERQRGRYRLGEVRGRVAICVGGHLCEAGGKGEWRQVPFRVKGDELTLGQAKGSPRVWRRIASSP